MPSWPPATPQCYNATTEITWPAASAKFRDQDAQSDALLTWTHLGHGVTRYEVWRSSAPYFAPGESGSEQRGEALPPDSGSAVSYPDAGALGTAGTRYFYVILPISASGIPYPASNRVGVVNFALAAGAP